MSSVPRRLGMKGLWVRLLVRTESTKPLEPSLERQPMACNGTKPSVNRVPGPIDLFQGRTQFIIVNQRTNYEQNLWAQNILLSILDSCDEKKNPLFLFSLLDYKLLCNPKAIKSFCSHVFTYQLALILLHLLFGKR